MAKLKIMLYKSNQRKDGSCPICLRVAKQDKVKYISLGKKGCPVCRPLGIAKHQYIRTDWTTHIWLSAVPRIYIR